MDRHRVVAVIASAFLAVMLAGCGGSSATPSAGSSQAATEVPVSTEAPSAAASDAAPSASVAPHTTATALCPGVAMRKEAKTGGDVIVRVKAGAKVRVVQVVIGDAYSAGSCGVSGDSWLKVDRIGAKSVKTLYGVPFGYVAAGFFH